MTVPSEDPILLNRSREDPPISPRQSPHDNLLDEKAEAYQSSNWPNPLPSCRFPRFRAIFRNLLAIHRPRTLESTEAMSDELDEESGQRLLQPNEKSPRWTEISFSTREWLVWPLPSYIHHFFLTQTEAAEARRATDYLDGIRGFASLFVFFSHYLGNSPNKPIRSYGFGASGHWNFFQLPFVRTLFAGSAMVSLFFVVSGYVLSYQSIVAYRRGKHDKLFSTLSSLAFRRGIRLFLPCIVSGLCGLVFVLIGILEPEHPRNWSISGELINFAQNVDRELFKFWSWKVDWNFWYAHQVWTIPIEFKCSMALFVLILIVARCKQHVRFVIQFVTVAYLFYQGRWDVATFVAGMVIAEINVIYNEHKETTLALWRKYSASSNEDACGLARKSHFTNMILRTLLWALFIFAWYLSGYPPIDASKTPGYSWLTQWWRVHPDAEFRFWLSQSAIFLLFAMSFLRPVQVLFTTSFARYLGKLSFSLYLVHELLNRTLRLVLWRFFLSLVHHEEKEGADGKYQAGWLMATIIYVPLVLWVADVFWRAVDVPTVKFAKWLERKCFHPAVS